MKAPRVHGLCSTSRYRAQDSFKRESSAEQRCFNVKSFDHFPGHACVFQRNSRMDGVNIRFLFVVVIFCFWRIGPLPDFRTRSSSGAADGASLF